MAAACPSGGDEDGDRIIMKCGSFIMSIRGLISSSSSSLLLSPVVARGPSNPTLSPSSQVATTNQLILPILLLLLYNVDRWIIMDFFYLSSSSSRWVPTHRQRHQHHLQESRVITIIKEIIGIFTSDWIKVERGMKIDSGSNGKDKQENATREQTPSFYFSINHSSINDDIYYADDTARRRRVRLQSILCRGLTNNKEWNECFTRLLW